MERIRFHGVARSYVSSVCREKSRALASRARSVQISRRSLVGRAPCRYVSVRLPGESQLSCFVQELLMSHGALCWLKAHRFAGRSRPLLLRARRIIVSRRSLLDCTSRSYASSICLKTSQSPHRPVDRSPDSWLNEALFAGLCVSYASFVGLPGEAEYSCLVQESRKSHGALSQVTHHVDTSRRFAGRNGWILPRARIIELSRRSFPLLNLFG